MEIWKQIVDLAGQFFTILWKIITVAWAWSFGQIVAMYQVDVMRLSDPKIIIYIAVTIAIVYFVYKAGRDLLGALMKILSAITGFFGALVHNLPGVVFAGVVALGGAYVINYVPIDFKIPYMDQLRNIPSIGTNTNN